MVIRSDGTMILVGTTLSTNLPTTPGAYRTLWNGGEEAFVFVGDYRGTVAVIRRRDLKVMRILKAPQIIPGAVVSMAFDAAGPTLYACHATGRVHVWKGCTIFGVPEGIKEKKKKVKKRKAGATTKGGKDEKKRKKCRG